MNQKKLTALKTVLGVTVELLDKCGGPGSGIPGPCPGFGRKPKPPKAGRKPKKQEPKEEPKKKFEPWDSQSKHTNKFGEWSEERKALHKKIIDSHFEGKTPVKSPKATVLGGGPASGKSSIIKQGKVKVDKNTVHIDSDAIKAMLPEYKEMVAKKDLKAAAYVHEESSYLAKKIQKKGSQGSYNTLLDGTGDSSYEKLKAKVQKMRDSGQKVEGHYVTVPTEMAIERNRARAKKTGRLPPEGMVRRCHASVSNVLGKALKDGLFDEVSLYDTSAGGEAVKVVSGKGKSYKIHDAKLFKSFLDKAKEGRPN